LKKKGGPLPYLPVRIKKKRKGVGSERHKVGGEERGKKKRECFKLFNNFYFKKGSGEGKRGKGRRKGRWGGGRK